MATPRPAAAESLWLQRTFAYRGRGHALGLLAGSAVAAAAGLGLLRLGKRLFPGRRRLLRVAALPLGLTLVAFYVGLAQLVLGERSRTLADGSGQTDPFLLAVVLASFVLFLLSVIRLGFYALG